MTAARLREIADDLRKYGDIETSPVVLQKTSVVPARAIEDLEKFADEIEDFAKRFVGVV